MKTIRQQEWFKLKHKRSAWLIPAILVVLIGLLAGATRHGTYKDRLFYISSAYAGFQWTMLMIIVVAASCISMEFEYGTMKQLAIQARSRRQVFLVKFNIVLEYSCILHLISVLATLMLVQLIFPTINLQTRYLYHQSLWLNLVTNAGLDFYGSLVVISLVFLVASLGRSSAMSVALGVAVCFLGEGLSHLIMHALPRWVTLIRWNPFNMLYLQEQYGNGAYEHVTHLTNWQLFWGNLGWSGLLMVIGMIIFSKRHI